MQLLSELKRMIFERPAFAGLFVFLLIVSILPQWLIDMIIYRRDLIEGGQWWRIITGHWVHLNWQHMLLNTGGLLLVLWVCPKWFGRWQGIVFFIVLCLVDGLGLLIFNQDLWQYTGVSGVLYGLMVVAFFYSPFYSLWIRGLATGIVIVKVLWEQTPWYSDDSISGFINASVAYDAHLFGMIGGLGLILVLELKRFFSRPAYEN